MTRLFEGLGINTNFDRVQSISGLSTCLMNNTRPKTVTQIKSCCLPLL